MASVLMCAHCMEAKETYLARWNGRIVRLCHDCRASILAVIDALIRSMETPAERRMFVPGGIKYPGVFWNRRCRKWQAQWQRKYLGIFNTPEEAHAAVCVAKQRA